MILQSLILDNLVSRCMKIMNSVVVVGLYYGFLITFSIGPSYLFLLRARVMEEGTEKKASATTGFIAGQLIMFISIYYAPLHLALGRPYTVTVIVLPYLLFHFLGKNHKHFFNYGYKNPNSIRNFSIQKIFFNNLIFQLLNPFLPSSMLVRLRLATIYMFQCNNKLLFLTSSFVGWLIGHTLLMKWIRLILVWIKQNNSIQSNVPIRFNKYIMSANKYISMSQIFIVFLFITCLCYLGRTPPAFFSKKLSEILEKREIEKKKKIDVERTSERAGTKQKQKRDTEKYIFPEKDKEKNIFGFKKTLVTILFDYKRWHRPLRYIKNDQFENGIRNEISQFFFHTCQSDGKEIIFFTYPPNLLTFIQIIEKKISLLTTEKTSYNQLANYWSFPNDEKTKKLNNEFINRAKVLDKEFIPLDIFEKRIRLCNDETKAKYLPKIYDPFLNGPCRGRIKKFFSTSIKNETYPKNNILINKIHGILLNINSNYSEFEQKIDTLNIKSLLTEISFFLNLINKISGKSVSNLNFETLYLFREQKQIKMVDFEEKKRKIEFLFDTIRTDLNGKTVVNRKKCIGIKEISKKVPRWSYKLIDELQQLEGKNTAESYGIRSRKAKRVVIFTNNSQNDDTYSDTRDADNTEKNKELALIRYSQQSDFRRDIIKGSIRAQRRKIGTWKLFLRSAHSPLFLDKIEKPSFVSFDIFEPMKIFFMLKNWMRKKTEILISNYTKKKTKESEKEEDKKKNEKEEKRRIEIGEAWDTIIFAQVIRGFLLITQSILRKYIILPSLIITKNIIRILLFQFPEWSEDFRDWKREMYIKCTYNGVQLSEREFPKNWLTDGIQIKILFPFRLKPWHRSKLQYSEKDPMKKKGKKKKQDFCFLTIWGMEVELPFSGYPRNRLSFFDPIFKELKKKMKKFNFFFFLVVKVLNERTKLFLNVSKDTVKWIIKSILKRILFLNEKIKKLPNSLFLFRFKKKNSTINTTNTIIYESPIPIQSINWTNYSLTEQKIKNMNAKTKTIRKQIEKMTKEKKRRGFLISEINISSNKTTYDAKKLELQKNIWQILQRKKARLARKSYSFFKFFFMERVYIDIFICIISIPTIILQLFIFLESTKKMINKSIYNNNNEANAERNEKTNQSIIQLIKIIKKSYNIRNTNSQNELYSLSQAYVFYKLFQIHVINVYKYKLRSVFEYNRRSFFLKNEIKDYFFGVHGIFHFKLRHKNPPDYVMNQWTNWLKGHSQYDLSQSTWSKLVPQKWRNRINKRRVAESKDLTKCDSYEKNRLMLYKKEQVNSLTKKKKMKKQYGYDLLSYKSINYVDKKDSYIYGYRLPFQANKKKPVICYNYNMRKQKLFDITGDISITNYIAEGDIIDMKKNLDRKYFDRMKMDVEIQNRSTILNPEFLLFSKLVIFYNAYTNNPWIVPIKLLFINFNVNKNVSENKNISGKNKIIDIFRPSKKKSLELELETRNQAKAEYAGRVDLESSISNQEKDIEEDSAGSDRTNDKSIKKKKYKNKIEEELNLLLRKYLSFQLNWKGSLNQRIMNNITIYCLLIRLINLKQIAIASIQRGELSLDIMAIQNQKALTLTEFGKNKNKELMKKGILIIESVRLSRKNDEQFIMYQTIGLSLIHKNKRQINPQYPEKTRVDKKTFNKSITRTKDQKITENQEKNHYDLPVPENILSSRRRRELRILICFTPRNRNSVYRKTTFSNENKVNNCCQVLAKNKDFDRKKKKNLINFKLFLWPIYRLEDLSCMNRYWFDTNNGSRFSIVRIHIYPQLKIR
uniref:Protein TIC 214 n=2 Tax=Sophora TaxID=3896 RepID=A0A5Q0U0H5_9FABA|nr:Ycf1 [Sophora flavescens]QGA73976.1 ycf1 [Sophora alopecuroides var. alopecuroides]